MKSIRQFIAAQLIKLGLIKLGKWVQPNAGPIGTPPK